MKNIIMSFSAAILFLSCNAQAQQPAPSLVDYTSYEQLVAEVKSHRAARLLPLQQFLAKRNEANTIVLDTRLKEMYDRKHIAGAVHLNFSDFTQQNLDDIMSRYSGNQTQILIYCNNNFKDSTKLNLQDRAFISKVARPLPSKKLMDKNIEPIKAKPLTLALNIPTYINLYGYGYMNVYELSELVDVNDSRIRFEGTDVSN